jgi:hypothetical protein
VFIESNRTFLSLVVFYIVTKVEAFTIDASSSHDNHLIVLIDDGIDLCLSILLFVNISRGYLGGLSQNGFTGEAKSGEVKKYGFTWLLIHFHPNLQNSFMLHYSTLICAKYVKPKLLKSLPNGP